MAYRNGTYVAFHANGTNRPGQSDIDYYNLLKAWHENDDIDFSMVNSHEKACAVRDCSLADTLRASLMQRLRNSKNMLLIIGETTCYDDDWVPFEIEKAVDVYKLPIIAAYTFIQSPIRNPNALALHWPWALKRRIDSGEAKVIHMPFKKAPINDAISQFSPSNLPSWPYYSDAAYEHFGIPG